jgi:outer membrane protein OmpA-like peptidoglycan-associated protein
LIRPKCNAPLRWWAATVLALGATASAAQAPIADASVEDIVNKLAPTATSRTRGLSRNIVPQQRQIELVVNFDFDSARLQPQSVPQLQRLAEAMKNQRLESARFRVEGHTDAKGTPGYNEQLSARRAAAVVEFLQSEGVSAGRLQAEGRGFSELLNRANPLAPENRRVRIVALE